VSNLASKGMGSGDRDCDPTLFIGAVIMFGILSEFVYRLSVSPDLCSPFLAFQQRALLFIGYTPVACFHRVCQTKNYLQYSQFILCCGLATVYFVTIMIWPEKINMLVVRLEQGDESNSLAKTRRARRLASLSPACIATNNF
jgi:hypothetical protein